MTRRVLVAATCALVAGAAGAGDWPQFRGSARDGRALAAAADDPPTLRLVWSHPLGPGYSGVTVAGGIAVTLYADGERENVVAFDAADGTLSWAYAVGPATRSFNGAPSKPPASTPLVHRGIVYGLGAHGRLFALRLADGTEIWSRGIEGRAPVHGHSASPLVHGKALVVATGGADGHAVTAYDRRDGTVLWAYGDERIAYQSPLVARLAGRPLLLVPGNDLLLGLDPDRGELVFRHRHDADDGDGYSVPLAVPLPAAAGGAARDGVVLNYREGAALYRARRAPAGLRLEEVWRSSALGDSYAAPVLHDGHLYGFGGEALRCIDLATGTEVWRERLPGGRGLIAVGERLVLFAPQGALVIADASAAGYRERARLAVAAADGYTWPSYADGIVYVRDHTRIVAVALGSADADALPAGADTAALP